MRAVCTACYLLSVTHTTTTGRLDAMNDSPFKIGDRVEFRAETPQYAKNQGITYAVVEAPNGAWSSVDNTHDDGPRVYVWLVDVSTLHLTPSRQRRRTGYVGSLMLADDGLTRVVLPSGCTIDGETWAAMAADGTWRGWLDARMYVQADRDFMDAELAKAGV